MRTRDILLMCFIGLSVGTCFFDDPISYRTDGGASVGSTGGNLTATAISTGPWHTCALLADNTVKCWGRNRGMLGDGTTVDYRTTPISVSGISTATAISLGPGFGVSTNCALLADNTVKCWGWLGQQLSTTPVSVSGISTATAISAGTHHSCALLADNTVKCLGTNASGQLGDGTTTSRTTPVSVSGISTATAISIGVDHSCALLADNTVKCWGENSEGELGDGTTTNRSTPVTVQY